MTDEGKQTTESEWRLKGLKKMIKEVFMGALEVERSDEKTDSNEIVHHMNKFCNNISTSLQQAYGNVTLVIPDVSEEMSDEQVVHDIQLMKQLENAVEEWTDTIRETINKSSQNDKTRLHDSASGETDYWRNRSALFNTLHQQLNKQQVKRILNILNGQETSDTNNLEEYKQQFNEFTKLYAQAKDFVKFLQTLERQFRNLGSGSLTTIDETLPSLLNGLKLIWTISRHINQNEDRFEHILEAISNEICQKVRKEIDIKKIFFESGASKKIDQATKVLKNWKENYDRTKHEIELANSMNRWEFTNTKAIFSKPLHMITILQDIVSACQVMREFQEILGPDLKQVTGSAELIDNVFNRVKDNVNKLVNFPNDVFNVDFHSDWGVTFQGFQTAIQSVEQETCGLLNTTFEEKLSSSENAFDLLTKFKDVETREAIHDVLETKYANVLDRYNEEVKEMEQLYLQYEKSECPIPKNMPPRSGSICWARSIVTRIKTPIDKFISKPEILTQIDAGRAAAKNYVRIAKELNEQYETTRFNDWKTKNTIEAIEMLHKNILRHSVDDAGLSVFKVNFNPKLKVIIREAKFLDRIGKDIPATIVNIALQEKDYMKYIDKLNGLLRHYQTAMGGLKPVEKKLLTNDLEMLNIQMKKGARDYNWFSLSISEYLTSCRKQIDKFQETKTRVLSQAANIEKKVVAIASAEIIRPIDFKTHTIREAQDLMDWFDLARNQKLGELTKDYEKIGSQFLRSIEECTFQTRTCMREEMLAYYQYWERRVFNAITSMIIRALSINKAILLNREIKPLIRMEAGNNNLEIIYQPLPEEMQSQLEKFHKGIIESTKQFGRWKNTTCQVFQEQVDQDTSERMIKYTFYDDIIKNPVITALSKDIIDAVQKLVSKFEFYNSALMSFPLFKALYDTNKFNHEQRKMEKHLVDTQQVELQIIKFRQYKSICQNSIGKTQQNGPILIDFGAVYSTAVKEADKWLEMMGKSLSDNARQKLNKTLKTIKDWEESFKVELDYNSIKDLLTSIKNIRGRSMDMEIQIGEVLEQFRVLEMYEHPIDPEDQDKVTNLPKIWENLLEIAMRKDHQVGGYKDRFARSTTQIIETFKQEVTREFENYEANGPGADQVSLHQGLELLTQSIENCKLLNIRKNEYIMSEQLFNLPLSKYPNLIKMEDYNEVYTKIYSIYSHHAEKVKEWSVISWTKLDANVLKEEADSQESQVRKLKKSLPNAEKYNPFVKLQSTIIGFKNSLPLIEQLRNPAIQERHWNRIIEESGKYDEVGEINLKTINLSKVFELELHNYQEVVSAVCNEAVQELKNEDQVKEIEEGWKNTFFEITPYPKKGEGDVIYVICKPEEIRQQLEDHIMTLQSVGASKYARSVKAAVARWEKDLNLITDCIEKWMQTQRQWQYLESIFSGEDIKQQLPDQAKKFNNIDKKWSDIMGSVKNNKNVRHQCVIVEGGQRFDQITGISFQLDALQKSLTSYLESKKMAFPRFYALSEEDLLQILGSADPETIQPYLLKLFDACKMLKFEQGGKLITAMTSDEGETYKFVIPVKPEGNVEDWMGRIDAEMKRTLHFLTKEAIFLYARMDRMEWIKKQIGMVAIIGTQIWWTFAVEDVFKLVQTDKHAMKKELLKESEDIVDLVALIRTDIDTSLRKSINCLIILDVHARDIVDAFVRDSKLSAKEFAWESQLRFYWTQSDDDISVHQCTGILTYCYEYMGLNSRLVITPLTDRCIMTLTTALTFYLGGAPAGPAGTGKTETVRDLAKALALRCLVTCCGETLDYVAIGMNFMGLIQTGFWGCFDEFNRINREVLSVVSAQIKTVQNGLVRKSKVINFMEQDIPLIHTIGIFITMNPGYAGRSELPDNLKALFRPVTMVAPGLVMICENMLMSEGFNTAKVLALKMVTLYKLTKEQLSFQWHYEFGLRPIKSVLVQAGFLKRSYPDMPEDAVLMRALRDMNMPKFVFDDEPLFKGLLQDLFPGLRADVVGNEDLKANSADYLEASGYGSREDKYFTDQISKVVQLFETSSTRHTTMVVGPTSGGKSVIIKTLAEALRMETDIKTNIDVINAKSITLEELYGVLDPDSRDWTDGLLSKIYKSANVPPLPNAEPIRNWILYDGDVDAIWIENMNSVMDDNKILTLANGDRITLQKHCIMMFEVFDLQYSSPATISRCGMVYIDPKNLGYEPFYQRWLLTKKKSESLHDNLKDLYKKYFPLVMDRIYEGTLGDSDELAEPLKFITPRTNVNLIAQLTILIDAILPEEIEAAPQDFSALERLYLFCLTWSCGGCLVENDRVIFDQFLHQLAQTMLPHNLYDNVFDIKSQKLDFWDKRVLEYQPPTDGRYASILVPTMDTTRYSWLLNSVAHKKKPVLFCGDSGAAKTVTVFYAFQQLDPDEYVYLNVNFSSRTSSSDFQSIIGENIDRKSGKIFGPKTMGKKLIVFIDDMNMPTIDKYGTQQPNALLKFLVEKNQMYERKGDLELLTLVDLQYVGCTTPPAGGNNVVDPRLMSLFTVFNVTPPSKDSTMKIYNQILSKKLVEFPEDVQSVVATITNATLMLYQSVKDALPRTPLKFHYLFNLRNLSSIYEGLYQCTVDKVNDKGKLIRMWRNECMRVFVDRLISAEDKELVGVKLIGDLTAKFFSEAQEEIMADPLIFGDFALSDPSDPEAEDPRLYEDLATYENVREKMDKILEEYNFEYAPMPLVLFNECLDHICKVHRILRMPKGSGLLVGFGGSGKQSVTKLATYLAGYKTWNINLIRNYKESDFRTDLQDLYKLVLQKPRTFLFTDAHVAEEGFLELINNILTIGMVPALFPEEEKEGLCQQVDAEIKKNKLPDSKEFRWAYFVKKARENLHVMMAMSPSGDTLRIRCRNFPGLVSNTTIDWFFPWPLDALTDVATHFLQEVELDSEYRQNVTEHITSIHLGVQQYSIEFDQVYKRKNFSTPKNYLDFINNYILFLNGRRKELDSAVIRLEGGLSTLEDAATSTAELQATLAIQNAEIAEKKTDVEAIIVTVNAQTETANKQSAIAIKTEAELAISSKEIAEIAEEARVAVAAAEPALARAKDALLLVKKPDIQEMKALAQPPAAIKHVCTIVFHYMVKDSKDDGWDIVKVKLLANPKLTDELQNKDMGDINAGQASRAKKKMSDLKKEPDFKGLEEEDLCAAIAKKSGPTMGLFKWCLATEECYEIFRDVEPKRKKAEQMRIKSEQSAKQLKEIKEQVAALNESLAKLNKNKAEKVAILTDLETTAAKMAKRLNAASKLISGLAGEQKRWTADMTNFQVDKIKLTGDCLSASAFLSYCGPFNFALRAKMLFEDWKPDLIAKNIPNKEDFKLETFLSDDVEVSNWASQGLPTDELSVQNGILTTRSSRWPLCIDPQMQAVAWIKEKEKKNNLLVMTFNTDGFVKRLENAIKFGQSVLFEGIDTELDPIIDPVLEKNITKEAGVEVLKMGDSKIEYNADFKMSLITKLPNPAYSPEIFGKTMIINFSVTMAGLKDQLLNMVVEYEKPELEKMRKDLIVQTAANKSELKELEDLLLSELSKKSDVPLVDNEPLIEVLETAKTKSIEISESLEVAKETSAQIDASRQEYTQVAKRGSILFFCMTSLSSISSMYEYSLTSYVVIFQNGLEQSKKDNVLPARIRFIIEKLTSLFYEFVCMGIFEAHKLVFSFQMTTMIMDGELELVRKELDFFLKGNTSLEEVESNPLKWLSDASWKDATKLESIGGPFQGFLENVKGYHKQWKNWYDEQEPEMVPMPCGYSDSLNKFQQLLVCRIFRQDRVVNAVKNFIINRMSPYYVQSPPLLYDKIYKMSTEKTPIVFTLSPGADPQSEVQRLADDLGFGQSKFRFLALGQGMEGRAKEMIEGGSIRGHWIMLNNCHLLVKWLKTMEAIIENLQKSDKNFRLWLTTEPTDGFPLGILQKSLKVVTEPPDGLGANIRQIYTRLTPDMLEESERPEFKQLIYVLAFFHATIQERKKFGKIGWNIKYDFNDSDFRISFKLIALYMNKAQDDGDEELPWETLRYLIGEAMYGGRVTNDYDRRAMMTYLEEFCGDFIFDTNQKFYFSRAGYDYTIADKETLEQYMDAIEEIPLFTNPGVFGLHANAEIIYFTNYAKDMWKNTLEMSTSEGGADGGSNKEEYISSVATDIQSKLPELFDTYNIKKKFEIPTPTQVVLMQELDRFNILLDTMHKSLADLQKALAGVIGMGEALESLGNSLFNGFVPEAWKTKAPQTLKALVSWMEHFIARHKQYLDWDEIEEPKVMWLSGLATPESYLTALVQTTCRAKGWALDKSIMYTIVTKEKDSSKIKKKLEHGCYIRGLYLEGARYNSEKDCLDYQRPKELIEEMPLLQVIPVEANKLKLRNTIKTPVYVTQDRQNAMGKGLVFEADIKTDKHISHWVLQGVCLVLNTDS